ncbi:MAG: hypothetical protein ABSD20_20140 [Terriglobales bacterium]
MSELLPCRSAATVERAIARGDEWCDLPEVSVPFSYARPVKTRPDFKRESLGDNPSPTSAR